MACASCGKPTKWSIRELIGDVQICDSCSETQEVQNEYGDLHIESNVDLSDIPDEIREQLLEITNQEGFDPQNTEVIALKISELIKDNPELLEDLIKKVELIAARMMFLNCARDFVHSMHALYHIGVDEVEITSIVRRMTEIQREVIGDYLFPDEESRPGLLDNLYELNLKHAISCQHEPDEEEESEDEEEENNDESNN